MDLVRGRRSTGAPALHCCSSPDAFVRLPLLEQGDG